MSINNAIHWHEGLFMLPHHMQHMQRVISRDMEAERLMNFVYPYGVQQLDFKLERLKYEGVIEFTNLKIVMKSGEIIDLHNNAFIQTKNVVDSLKKAERPLIVYIGLAHWSERKGNSIFNQEPQNSDEIKLYKVEEIDVFDENTGTNSKPIMIRKLNLKIFLEGDPMDGYDTIPIGKVSLGVGNKMGKVCLDENFAPPCFFISGVLPLKDLISGVLSKLIFHTKKYREELLGYYGFNHGSLKFQRATTKLMLITSTVLELRNLLKSENCTPLQVYNNISSLIAKLTAIIPSYFDPFEIPEYSHDQPLSCFNKLKKILDGLLVVQLFKNNYKVYTFNEDTVNIYKTSVEEEYFKRAKNYYICITSDITSDDLIEIVEKGVSFKALAYSKLRLMAIPGFKLDYKQIIPEDFPKKDNQYFFRISKRQKEMWNSFAKEKIMAIHIKTNNDIKQISKIELFVELNETEVKT